MGESLPNNWVSTELGNYIYLKNGYAYKTSQFKDTGIPILKISNITRNGKVDITNPQFVDERDLSTSFLVRRGDIVIAMSGATTGKFGIYESDELLLQNQRVGNIKLRSEIYGNKQFVYYLIGYLKKEIEERAYGGAQPNISPALIESIKIPLPPLAEQERIAAKLDTLFAQHEAMKKALERIPKLLKDFRQQVLTQAVTGKLTEKWREENKFGDTELFKLNDICDSITDGDHQAPPQVAEGIPFLVISNVSKGLFNFESVNRFVPIEYFQNLKSTRVPKIGDILYTVTGSYGIALLVDFDKKFCFQRHIAILRPNVELVDSTYLTYFLNSPVGKAQADEMATGTAQLTVSLTSIKGFEIELPNIEEQNEIVSRVKSLFQSANIIENEYLKLKQKINSLPQAILHKAFKGELVAQLPTDGDARHLLEEIKKLKIKK